MTSWTGRLLNWTIALSALAAVSLTVLDLTGATKLPWFKETVPHLTLLAVGTLLLTAWIDRTSTLDGLRKSIQALHDQQRLGLTYLQSPELVLQSLESLVTEASEKVLSIGSKSTASTYLDAISKRACNGELVYCRLLTGDHITHTLHMHLLPLIPLKNVTVGWTYSEKYGGMTVSERGAVLVLPTPHPKRFRGIAFIGEHHATHFSEAFREATSIATSISSDASLSLLCEDCGADTDRRETHLQRALKRVERASP